MMRENVNVSFALLSSKLKYRVQMYKNGNSKRFGSKVVGR